MKFINRIFSRFHKDDPAQFRKELLWLFRRMMRHKVMVVMVCVLGLIGTLMGLASSVATKYLIDAVTLRNNSLLTAALLTLFMMLGSFALQALSSRISARVHIKVRNDNQSLTFGKILHAGWEALEPYRSGDLLNRISSDANTCFL